MLRVTRLNVKSVPCFCCVAWIGGGKDKYQSVVVKGWSQLSDQARCSEAGHGGEVLQELIGQGYWVGFHEDVEVTQDDGNA